MPDWASTSVSSKARGNNAIDMIGQGVLWHRSKDNEVLVTNIFGFTTEPSKGSWVTVVPQNGANTMQLAVVSTKMRNDGDMDDGLWWEVDCPKVLISIQSSAPWTPRAIKNRTS